SFVSSKSMPNEQRQMGYMMMIISPIMIVWISLSSASALGLYWSVSAAFLIVQTQVANMYYSNLAKKEVAPMIEAMKNNNSEKASKGKNTQVAPKKSKKK
ncbi:membrane protein insertase YidC, partial [Staphylococcus cohnii]